MSGYSTDEITSAVTKLVQSTITRSSDTLGPVRSDISFGDIQNAAAGVFLLYPKAPFYCLFLGSSRVSQQVSTEAQILEQLLAAIQAVGRSVLPINDLTPLFNSVAALQALGTAAAQRSNTFQDISKVPAYQRFTANTQAFLATSGRTVKSQGQVVMTPQEARQQIPTLVGQLRESHQELVASVTALAHGGEDYSKVNLASAVAQFVIANATTSLSDHANALNALQPSERLASIRQVVLDVIAAQATVTKYGSFGGAIDIYNVLGTGRPYADANHPALGAVALATKPGPYNIQSPNQYLDVYLNGAGTTPRSQTSLIDIAPVPNTTQANFDGPVGIDVVAGDYVFVKSGPNAGTRWLIQQVFATTLLCNGAAAAVVDTGPVTVEILPAPSVELVLPFSFAAQILGIVSESQFTTGTGYLIGDGTHPTRPGGVGIPNNNRLILQVNSTPYTVPLTVSADASVTGPFQVQGTVDIALLTYGSGGPLENTTFVFRVDSGPILTTTFLGLTTFHSLSTQIKATIAAQYGASGIGIGPAYSASSNLTGSPSFLQVIGNTAPGAGVGIEILGGTSLSQLGFTAGQKSVYIADATPRTAQQVCDDINAVMVAHDFRADPYFPLVKFQGAVIETASIGSSATFALVGGIGSFTNLNVNPGDLLVVLTGDPTQQGLWTVTAVTTTTITATLQSGAPVLTQSFSIQIQVGAALRNIKLTATSPTAAVAGLVTLTVVNDNGVAFSGAQTLGLSPGGTSRSRPSTSQDLAAFINKASTLLTSAAILSPTVASQAHSNAGNSFVVTLSKLQGSAPTTVTGGTIVTPLKGAATAGVIIGDVLVERGGSAPGTVWHVTAVDDLSVTGTLLSGSSSSQTNVSLEIGPDVALNPYNLVRVLSGPCAGDYYVSSQSVLDITLTSSLAIGSDPITGQPLTFPIQAGTEALSISSKDVTTASLVKLRGPAQASFFSSGDKAVTTGVPGTTAFFQIPQLPQGLDVGDLLQLFATNYNIPTQTLTLTAVEGTILTLDRAIDSNVSWVFGPNAQVPYARLRAGHTADFDSFSQSLEVWVNSPEQQDAFFTNLNRLINPLLSNSSPTALQIGNAAQAIIGLYGQLTNAANEKYGPFTEQTLEATLASYVIPHQAAVDALIRSYLEKGADRAVDLLLGGSFTTFFALDPESTSYAGTMSAAARAVAMNDLPVKKANRSNALTSRLKGSGQDPDPEYNFDDTTSLVPDPLSAEERADGS